jgi:hypothetical protein
MPTVDMEVLAFEIAKLQLVGGDILVLRPPYTHPEALTHLDLKAMAEMVPPGVKIWVMPQDIEMVVISPPKEGA